MAEPVTCESCGTELRWDHWLGRWVDYYRRPEVSRKAARLAGPGTWESVAHTHRAPASQVAPA